MGCALSSAHQPKKAGFSREDRMTEDPPGRRDTLSQQVRGGVSADLTRPSDAPPTRGAVGGTSNPDPIAPETLTGDRPGTPPETMPGGSPIASPTGAVQFHGQISVD